MRVKLHIISHGMIFVVLILNQSSLIAESVDPVTVGVTVPTSTRTARWISVI